MGRLVQEGHERRPREPVVLQKQTVMSVGGKAAEQRCHPGVAVGKPPFPVHGFESCGERLARRRLSAFQCVRCSSARAARGVNRVWVPWWNLGKLRMKAEVDTVHSALLKEFPEGREEG